MYPTLQQDLNRIRHISQNQNTVEFNRKIIHPRRNRNFQTPRVTFSIPQSPTPTSSETSSITIPDTPTLTSQQTTPNIPSDYLGSIPTSTQLREYPFNPPLHHRTTTLLGNTTLSARRTKFSNDPIDTSLDTTLSSLPDTLSLPSTPSISQILPSFFPLNSPYNLDARYREQSTSIPLRLD